MYGCKHTGHMLCMYHTAMRVPVPLVLQVLVEGTRVNFIHRHKLAPAMHTDRLWQPEGGCQMLCACECVTLHRGRDCNVSYCHWQPQLHHAGGAALVLVRAWAYICVHVHTMYHTRRAVCTATRGGCTGVTVCGCQSARSVTSGCLVLLPVLSGASLIDAQ